jgi:tetratricopeptide (TPR) repeat protein
LAIEPDNVAARLALARLAVLENDRDEAARQLERVIAVDPNQANAVLGMAQLAAERGDYAAARTWLTNVAPSAARYDLEGRLYLVQRDYAAAATAFRRAFDNRPSGQRALQAFRAARQAGQPRPETVLLDWVAGNPRDVQAQSALAALELESGDYDAAVARYEAVVALDASFGPALNNLAWIYGERGDERALSYALRARDALPEDPSVADTLGWLYVQRGEAPSALPLLEQAARGLPDDLEVRYHWAEALAATGDPATASDVLASLLTQGADFPSKEQAEARLSELRSGSPR